jgi:hypothetical protein
MIENVKVHTEKSKLSDKFQQPFEQSATRDLVFKFNRRNQKKVKPKKRKK